MKRFTTFYVAIVLGITSLANGATTGISGDVTPGSAPTTWSLYSDNAYVGEDSTGSLTIVGGDTVSCYYGYAGYNSGGNGTITVDGAGSNLKVKNTFAAGWNGIGALHITNGGMVNDFYGYLGFGAGSVGTATIDGSGSTWKNDGGLVLNYSSNCTLTITNGGLASAVERIEVYDGNNNFINISSGGMLAFKCQDTSGDSVDASSSLSTFLSYLSADGGIRYWDDSSSSWSVITNGTAGQDYSLDYRTQGDLAGFTVLTAVPEPATMSLLALGGIAIIRRRRRK
ncbi:MAG: PEP-CTERM sorting domain-containing protein [Phycisphaerales bacterium]|nr:PEP-CTERM sorting domain-containing protein [Phycisphaerales bacterium]